MGLAADFKEFAVKGNAMDLAVGVIIGAAFSKIVDSIVNDLIMPIVGAIFGGLDFSSYFVLLGPVPDGYSGSMTDYEALKAAGAPVLGWGQFVTVLINFLILAFIIFLLVRWASRLRPKAEEAAAVDAAEVVLLREIRDELRGRNPL